MFDTNNVFHLNQDELIQVLSAAFSCTLKRDRELYDTPNQVQERTFMHRFAFELHKKFRKFENARDLNGRPILSLDVEYNRDGDDLKRMTARKKKRKWYAPDIVFHQRCSGKLTGDEQYKNDVFVCELKKDGSPDEDRRRVKRMVRKLKYQYGINFYRMTKNSYEFEFYWGETRRDGKIVCHGPKIFRYNANVKKFMIIQHKEGVEQ